MCDALLTLYLIGWFLLLSSCVGFYRVKRWETSIRAASMPEEPVTEEQRAHDEQVRRNIEIAFGFTHLDDDEGVSLTACSAARRRCTASAAEPDVAGTSSPSLLVRRAAATACRRWRRAATKRHARGPTPTGVEPLLSRYRRPPFGRRPFCPSPFLAVALVLPSRPAVLSG